ncbi:phenylacetate-CoA oxygenase [Luteipulveratus mongoliensis]|uniref:Phenylacetate-CoA oxygenase n=1 Tax=Luteipulveratus mongoliensis TaxID=571913 RepID=A0A0K1JQS5_9MICO|nr:1,2-phenylacetyl-CoA epoxidase subunit PaaD [Luteipulveratus mongoliensis]AKU19074.1 phenylacetate-CoA oxygenase [Luteipulveratus mongoliensis]
MTAVATSSVDVLAAVRAIPDPEVPVITIDDLGILRSVDLDGDRLRVVITPTYSGCPAMEAIRANIQRVAADHGYEADVSMQLSPAWTTDWMSADGRDALARFGIAPPHVLKDGPVAVGLSVRQVTCPLCGSTDTEELSRFGSTSCKALRRCVSCREPFEEFKAL